MSQEQILEMVKEFFTEEWCEEDGQGWTEFSGKPDAFVKFAEAMFSAGYCDRKKDEEDALSTTWDD